LRVSGILLTPFFQRGLEQNQVVRFLRWCPSLLGRGRGTSSQQPPDGGLLTSRTTTSEIVQDLGAETFRQGQDLKCHRLHEGRIFRKDWVFPSTHAHGIHIEGGVEAFNDTDAAVGMVLVLDPIFSTDRARGSSPVLKASFVIQARHQEG